MLSLTESDDYSTTACNTLIELDRHNALQLTSEIREPILVTEKMKVNLISTYFLAAASDKRVLQS